QRNLESSRSPNESIGPRHDLRHSSLATSMAAIPRYRRTTGPALFSAGFRPFFLSQCALGRPRLIWLPAIAGEYQIPTIFPPVTWHVHEIVFGYGAALVAGFLHPDPQLDWADAAPGRAGGRRSTGVAAVPPGRR